MEHTVKDNIFFEIMVEMCYSYLQKYRWKRMDIGMSLERFEKTHSKKAISDLCYFIIKSKWNNIDNQIIATTIAHDLSGCKDKYILPRSSDNQGGK